MYMYRVYMYMYNMYFLGPKDVSLLEVTSFQRVLHTCTCTCDCTGFNVDCSWDLNTVDCHIVHIVHVQCTYMYVYIHMCESCSSTQKPCYDHEQVGYVVWNSREICGDAHVGVVGGAGHFEEEG